MTILAFPSVTWQERKCSKQYKAIIPKITEVKNKFENYFYGYTGICCAIFRKFNKRRL